MKTFYIVPDINGATEGPFERNLSEILLCNKINKRIFAIHYHIWIRASSRYNLYVKPTGIGTEEKGSGKAKVWSKS